MSERAFGLAYVGGGWAATATGQIRRATSICDKVARLLQPMWGAVRGEYYRGNARQTQAVDALAVIQTDRIRLLLEPLVRAGEISGLEVEVAAHSSSQKRRSATIRFVDTDGHVQQLSGYVRVP